MTREDEVEMKEEEEGETKTAFDVLELHEEACGLKHRCLRSASVGHNKC